MNNSAYVCFGFVVESGITLHGEGTNFVMEVVHLDKSYGSVGSPLCCAYVKITTLDERHSLVIRVDLRSAQIEKFLDKLDLWNKAVKGS